LPPGKIPNADFVKGVAIAATAFMLSDSSDSNPFYVIMSSNKNPPLFESAFRTRFAKKMML